jgi:hypothetical protein
MRGIGAFWGLDNKKSMTTESADGILLRDLKS